MFKQVSGILCTLIVLTLALAPAAQAEDSSPPIDINTAGVEELTSLPRIGPSIALRIVNYRDENGPFERVEELMNVRGIGQRTFEQLRERIAVTTRTADASSGS